MKGEWSRQRKWPKHRIAGVLTCEHCKRVYPAMTYQIKRKQRFCSGECRNHLSDIERFWIKVIKTNSCWVWMGASVSKRYGNMRFGNRSQLAHRVSWQIHHGEIPEGQNVLHKCDNGFCVRPNHLFLGTQIDNMRDCLVKDRRPVASKLSVPKVKLIRMSNRTDGELAAKFGVALRTIRDARKRRTWDYL